MTWTTPRTWTDGEVVTSAELNTHIRDDMLDLRSSSDWLPVAFQNAWANQTPGPETLYRRVGSMVEVVGHIHGGTLNTPAFTMLPGYAPSMRLMFTSWGEDSIATNQQERIDIDTAGNVYPVTGNNFAFAINVMFSIL